MMKIAIIFVIISFAVVFNEGNPVEKNDKIAMEDGVTVTTASPTVQDCHDRRKECSSWKEQNHCNETYVDWMKLYCTMTCGYCNLPCADSRTGCSFWKEQNYCKETYVDWMQLHCTKSCGYCKSGATTPAPTVKPETTQGATTAAATVKPEATTVKPETTQGATTPAPTVKPETTQGATTAATTVKPETTQGATTAAKTTVKPATTQGVATTASSVKPTPPATGPIAKCLSTHNKLRALHKDTPNLDWDTNLASDAQKWADHLASILDMVHSAGKDRPGQGENLAYGESYPDTAAPRTCEHAIIAWYNEIHDFDWKTRGKKTGKDIGHFTQLVWQKSTKLGMGITTRKANGKIYTYIVARYSPAGNVGGEYFENVLPLKGLASPCSSNPCMNNGVCIDKFIKYECQCSTMYKGSTCETKLACEDTFGGCGVHKAKICNGGQYKHYLPKCLVTCGKCTPDKKPVVKVCKDKIDMCKSRQDYICNGDGAQYKSFCEKTCGICSK